MNPQATTTTGSKLHRIETLATRVTSTEMQAIEAAAASRGTTRSEWLRACALTYLQRPDQSSHASIESTILEEVTALRLLLVNLFPAAIQGLQVDAVRQIMQFADSAKGREAARVLGHSIEDQVQR